MEIIVKIKTNEDFIKSILDEQDPELVKTLFTNPTLKEKFKIIEINNIEIDETTDILAALQNKKKRLNLLFKNFRKTKRATVATGKEGIRLGKVGLRKTKNATVKIVKTPVVAIAKGVKATGKAFMDEATEEYDEEKKKKKEAEKAAETAQIQEPAQSVNQTDTQTQNEPVTPFRSNRQDI